MLNNSLSVLAATEINWGKVGSTVVTGLVVVFLILAVLVFFLWIFGKIFKAINSASEKKERKKLIQRNDNMKSFRLDNNTTPKPAVTATVSADDSDEGSEYEDEDDEEIIAVIAAAIAAYGAADGKQYRITRVQRPKSARSAWSAAGLAENIRGSLN